MEFFSTKILDLGSCAFRQWKAEHSHCKYIHGYRLQAKFWFGCKSLDEKNWVVDFGGLKGLKQVLEKQFDHTTCIAADDPLRKKFEELHVLGAIDLRILEKGVGIERTAEWCYEAADKFVRNATQGRCWVEMVEVWEHDKNSAIYQKQKERPTEKPEAVAPTTEKINAEQYEFKLDVPEATKPTNNDPQPTPAAVGNKVTTGWSNPFGGTTWGL